MPRPPGVLFSLIEICDDFLEEARSDVGVEGVSTSSAFATTRLLNSPNMRGVLLLGSLKRGSWRLTVADLAVVALVLAVLELAR